MDSFPDVGMKCEQVRGRLKKLKTAIEPNVKASLINQARLCEGEGVVKELSKEFCGTNSRKHKTMNAKSRGNFNVGFCLKQYKDINDRLCSICNEYDKCTKKKGPGQIPESPVEQ